MKEQFTKGDWKLDGFQVYKSLDNNNKLCHRFTLADVTVFNEGRANAHLIAAAPKMYRMIDSLIKTLDDLYPSNAKDVADEHMSEFVAVNAMKVKAKELLAEARGENKDTD